MNSKEENSSNSCPNYVQEFSASGTQEGHRVRKLQLAATI